MRAITVLAFCVAAVAAVPSNPQRIVGGSATTIDRWPQMAALLYTFNWNAYWHYCGGTILNNRSILTAAHCPANDPPTRWRIRVGSTMSNSGGVVHNIANIINHANYNSATQDNDISILHTATPIEFTNNVVAAAIAGTNYNLGDNQVVWATGWGATFQSGWNVEQLREVQIWTINQQICIERYATLRAVTDNMLCSGWLDVGGRDQCQGDSGGPLYHNNVVVGVCSWGRGCAQAYYPGVNVRVSRYTAWIQSNA